jgi:hypothetical protein
MRFSLIDGREQYIVVFSDISSSLVLMPLASVESLPFRALLTLLLNPHGTTGD